MKSAKYFLRDVVILRPIIIIFIIGIHAFNPYADFMEAWPPLIYKSVPFYDFISVLFSTFLPLFVLISGYIYGNKREKNGGDIVKKTFIYKKIKRLIIPSLFFSLIYFYVIDYHPNNIIDTTLRILSGYGHLWFLPMLFWSFVVILFVNKYKEKGILAIFAFLFFIPIFGGGKSLGINEMIHYFIYFYLGYLYGDSRRNMMFKMKFVKRNYFFLSLVLFLLFCIIYYYFYQNYSTIKLGIDSLFLKYLLSVYHHAISLFVRLLAIFLMLVFSNLCVGKIEDRTMNLLIKFNTLAMGMYIFQQFILQIGYYRTDLSQYVNVYILPWVGMIIAVLLSAILTYAVRNFKYGRFMLGE